MDCAAKELKNVNIVGEKEINDFMAEAEIMKGKKKETITINVGKKEFDFPTLIVFLSLFEFRINTAS